MPKLPNETRVAFEGVFKNMFLLPPDGRLARGMLINLLKTGRPLESRQVLKNVSFTVGAGGAFGVVGDNGAGKTTLLRLAGGVLRPSRGKVLTKGRIAPLIDLAAGFVRELSGWDNIRLNAALLGMSSKEINGKIDAIVDFSGLEKTLSQPLKIYSWGMVLRLGFAIAASSDPAILLVDEVLAVGDYHFYAKCLKKVRDLKDNGTAIILVSHDTDQVAKICDQALWLKDGVPSSLGPVQKVLHDYRLYLCGVGWEVSTKKSNRQRWGTGDIRITRVEMPSEPLATGRPFRVTIHYRADRTVISPTFGIAIHRCDGAHITGPNTKTAKSFIPKIEAGEEGCIQYIVHELPLLPGSYLFSAAVYDQNDVVPLDHHDKLYPFAVAQGDHAERQGLVTIPARWQWEPKPALSTAVADIRI